MRRRRTSRSRAWSSNERIHNGPQARIHHRRKHSAVWMDGWAGGVGKRKRAKSESRRRRRAHHAKATARGEKKAKNSLTFGPPATRERAEGMRWRHLDVSPRASTRLYPRLRVRESAELKGMHCSGYSPSLCPLLTLGGRMPPKFIFDDWFFSSLVTDYLFPRLVTTKDDEGRRRTKRWKQRGCASAHDHRRGVKVIGLRVGAFLDLWSRRTRE